MDVPAAQPPIVDPTRLNSLVSPGRRSIYALHAFSLLTGIVGAATVIGAFLTGWPSIIAVILNYVKRGEVRGTWLESHFRWQIRTFWYGLLWVGALRALRFRDARHRDPRLRGCRSASWALVRSTGSPADGWRLATGADDTIESAQYR